MLVYANALIDVIALMTVIIVMAADRHMRSPGCVTDRNFQALLWLAAAGLTMDIPGWLLDGASFPGARIICYLLNTGYYVCQIVFCYIWLLFADDWSRGTEAKSAARKWLFAVPMLLELAVILVNPFTGWLFRIDEGNRYVRGAYYLVNLTAYYCYVAASLAIAARGFLRAREVEERRASLSLAAYMFLPICGGVLEAVLYGIAWMWPFLALSLLMICLSIQQRRLADERVAAARQAMEEAERKSALTDGRVDIMLSQIQPHFLYNALSAIQALCTRAPTLAARAVGDFTEFLRCNMDPLSADRSVPFSRELEHTKHYLALELIRFQERLNIVYDIQADLFRMPALTLQPVVENAVRYGVTKRVEGGTVRITTREAEDAFLVTVEDDGVGVAPTAKMPDGCARTGLQNVSDRLETMCGGTLVINSVPGVGTTAVITLPKRKLPGGALC